MNRNTIIALAILTVIYILSSCVQYRELQAYRNYYEQSEKFLTELDAHYDWIDAFDPEEFFNAEYEVMSIRGELPYQK